MGIFDKLFSSGAEKPQEETLGQAAMEVAHSSDQENMSPEDGAYDSGITFEDLEKEDYDPLEKLDRDIENLGKEDREAA